MAKDSDRDTLLRAHEAYLHANSLIDPQLLREVWDADPSNTWFNLSGHNYQGLGHWIALWNHYRDRIQTVSPWLASDVDAVIRGDVGWVTCSRSAILRWHGEEAQPLTLGEVRNRSTMIFVRRGGEWRAVHAHFSPESDMPRPGGI